MEKTFECSLPGCNRETLPLQLEVSHLCKTVAEMRCLLGLSEVISLLFEKYQATEQIKQVNGKTQPEHRVWFESGLRPCTCSGLFPNWFSLSSNPPELKTRCEAPFSVIATLIGAPNRTCSVSLPVCARPPLETQFSWLTPSTSPPPHVYRLLTD